jgi:uncharacterized protein (TIGR02231 family)
MREVDTIITAGKFTKLFSAGKTQTIISRLQTCFLLATFSPCLALAAPKEVIIFTQAARVTEVTKVRLLPEGKDLRKAVIVIPGTADPGSLVGFLPPEAKLKMEDQTWRKSPRDEEAPTKELRRQIRQAREERNGLQASLHGLDNQIQFWQQQTKAKAKTTIEAGIIAAAIGKNIKKAYQEKLNLGPEIPRLDKKIKELEGELSLTRGKDEQLGMWEVTFLFSVVAASVPANDILLTYSYTMTGCGWQPAYRFDARPLRGEILFDQEAEVWQNTGQPWNDVVVQLTTFTAPAAFLTPAALPPWNVKPREEIKTKVKRTTDKAKAMPRLTEWPAEGTGPAEGNEASPAALSDDFNLQTAGRKTIPTGSRLNIKLFEEVWPAAFGYLARPGQSSQAFISALFNFPEARKITPGQAIFSQQGALLGKSNFSLSGKQGLLFFGQDPQVTVTRQLLTDQPKHRKWRLEARNNHTAPIKLRIEESIPQAHDARIKIKLLATGAEEKPGLLSWDLELAAGEKRTLLYGIELEVPPDMEVESGFAP